MHLDEKTPAIAAKAFEEGRTLQMILFVSFKMEHLVRVCHVTLRSHLLSQSTLTDVCS